MMAVLDKLLALFLSVLILVQAWWVRGRVGTWLFPACLFGLFWFVFTFVPLAVLFDVRADPYATGYILLCTVAFSMGSLPFDWTTAFSQNEEKRETAEPLYANRFMRVAFHVSAVSSVVFLILNLLAQGISLHDLLVDLQGSAMTFATMLYSETLNESGFDRLATACAYLTPILGGLVFSGMPAKAARVRVALLSLLPSMFVALTQTTKGLLFLSLAFFYAGLLVVRMSTGRFSLVEKRHAKPIALSVAILLPLVTVSFLFRNLWDVDEGEFFTRLTSYWASYAFGHLYAFSDWVAFNLGHHSQLAYSPENAAHGFYTFTSLFRMMGSDKVVPLGVYDDYYTYGELLTTNIFTMFRGLILDFGVPGSLVFMLAAGVVLHGAFRVLLARRMPAFTVAVFVFMIGFIYNSYIISALSWNRMYAAFVLLWLVLAINRWRVSLMMPASQRVSSESNV